nr:DNA-3-methyladenine glycosylase I [Gulosibacter chungangensis]
MTSSEKIRCAWAAGSTIYSTYHDEEWGVPLHGDQELFERVSLEGFQAGLSWITILNKRPRFREVFAEFDPSIVANFGESKVAELMNDAGIVRNRQKIHAIIHNAQLVQAMPAGEFDALLWSFAPAMHTRPNTASEIPATTPESIALSKELRGRGFKFVGPTTMYALMQATGMVDDHVAGCWRAIP